MNYRVYIHPLAQSDYDSFFDYIEARSPKGALAWDEAFENAKVSLQRSPLAYSLIPDAVVGRDAYHQILFSTRHGDKYRAVYVVDGAQVTILRIRGKGQQFLLNRDLPNG